MIKTNIIYFVNVILFICVATLLIILGETKDLSTVFSSDLAKGLGLAMLGGVASGLTFFGTDFLHSWNNMDTKNTGDFLLVKKNKDMGEAYWIQFIDQIDRSGGDLWFVGNRHTTWIAKGLPYRKELANKLRSRIHVPARKQGARDFNTYILVKDKSAADRWKAFVNEEVISSKEYRSGNSNEIMVGVIDSSKTDVNYSIVAYAEGMVMTPYLSTGRTAESPSVALEPNSEVAGLYFADLTRIMGDVREWLEI